MTKQSHGGGIASGFAFTMTVVQWWDCFGKDPRNDKYTVVASVSEAISNDRRVSFPVD
ncbi:MAG: hypothetical protein ACUBOA_05810 [Candidatus Loosdrechtia sp.]|uniref:hypothetical protein n=1 Tax=Candidatus Loosdrechtia sp. TaxID=3101272 RepID=UPI003A613214|nr:MAG: hypothetical protein QY305_15000 [Candidatus Jettenia sp. AMX2]